MSQPFDFKDIEDAKIIIKAKGKSWGIMPNDELATTEEAKQARVELAKALLGFHDIITPSLEEIGENMRKERRKK